MEWQPIETAPKDKTQFIGRYVTGYHCDLWWYGDDYKPHRMDEIDIGSEPTHWMPLPPPPST